MKFELSYFLIDQLKNLMEKINQNIARTIISKSFPIEIFFIISMGNVPISSDGIANVKIKRIVP